MTFFSHSKISNNGQAEGSKLLKVHIQGVLDKAVSQLYSNVNLGIPHEQLEEILKTVVLFHDLGKYTTYFQNYLLQIPPIDKTLKQHAHFGGYATYNLQKNNGNKISVLTLYLIFLHHGQLIDFNEFPRKIEECIERKVFEAQFGDIQGKILEIENELGLKNLTELLQFPDEKQIRKSVRHWIIKEPKIRDYFLTNYLFSLLIEADKLDASETPVYKRLHLNDDYVDTRFGKPKYRNDLKELTGLSNNELRNYCRAQATSHLQKDDILTHRIFTLTAPTGIGKTMIALDFALKLKTKIREQENFEPQIIYALPFINIIEQSLAEYNKTLPQETRILGHYQFADVFGIQEDSDEEHYNQKLMKLDTWQGDVIITSFVQFFETLIGNRNKLLKKFNHFAGSIVILDEVQTLRLDQMPLIGAALFYLSKFLNTRLILMTATKPKIFELAEKEILNNEEEQVNALELLTPHEKVFARYERTTIYPLLDLLTEEKENRTDEFISKIFTSKWNERKSCIIVCNTVRRSIEVFEKINKYMGMGDFKNPLFYLSTNIIPAHRALRIQEIKDSISKGESPILVSTQVVEAGVDLDFDMGFRDIGPIDSIIQVAGRINRNDDQQRKNAPLYIVDFLKDDTIRVYGRLTYEQAHKALSGKSEIFEHGYLTLINQYFGEISDAKSFFDARQYFQSMKRLKYDSDKPKEDYAVSGFKIIEESNLYRTAFIEVDDRATECKEAFQELLNGKMKKEDFDKRFKKDFNQRIITIPQYYTGELQTIHSNADDIFIVAKNDTSESDEPFKKYYLTTGFNRKTESGVAIL